MTSSRDDVDVWPPLPWDEWKDTAATLHMWTQIVGKTRLSLTPLENHWWNVPLYVTARGLWTSPIPYDEQLFDIEFDFIQHRLVVRVSSGETQYLPLRPQSVAAFYREYLDLLDSMGLKIRINPMPVEIANPISFPDDTEHASYDPDAAHRFWRILHKADAIFKRFRAEFIGKSSPVHFFWGSFDLAVTRFSGRSAPPRPGADAVTREAYSHEVISAGFWPGNGGFGAPAFYAYAAPQPQRLNGAEIRPEKAFYDSNLGEFLLRYDDVRASDKPDEMLLNFLHSSYEAAADLSGWDRASLERSRQ